MKTKSNFVIWDSEVVKNACNLYELEGVEDDFELRKGIPRAAGFPENAVYTMHPDFPHNTIMVDNLLNTDFRIVASLRLKDFLAARKIPKLEYLRVTILNHKKKPASRDYFIVHPIEPVDCLEVDKCEPRWGRIDKAIIDKVGRLVIDEKKIDPERQIFRPNLFHRVILTRRTLAKAIDEAGFTGIKWIELEDYPSPRA